ATTVDANGTITGVARSSSQSCGSRGSSLCVVSPPIQPFLDLLPTPRDGTWRIQTPTALSPAPTVAPNTAAGEGRTIAHQAFNQFPPQVFYQVTQQQTQVSMSADLPLQSIWGFDGIAPGPVYHARYGQPILVRNVNHLPPDNG